MNKKSFIEEIESLKKGERYVIEGVNPKKEFEKFYKGHIFTVARITNDSVYVRFDDEIEKCIREDQLINEYLLTNDIWNNIVVNKLEKIDEESFC